MYIPDVNQTLPILVWFHGGGWVIGNVEGSEGVTRHLASTSGCAVLSVNYRLSPDVKFPGPLDDCYGVTKWVYDNAESLNIDQNRISVGGDSAGGNLAAAVCLRAKDDGQLPLVSQLLIYPCVDTDFTRKSYIKNKDDYALTATSMKWFWEQYINSDSDMDNPYVCPLKYSDHSGLPQACIIVAEHDPLLDEGIAYHNKLEKANVKSKLIKYSGVMHGFYSNIGVLDKSQKAMDASCEYLRSVMF
jgi:acetyl esterase